MLFRIVVHHNGWFRDRDRDRVRFRVRVIVCVL